MFDSYLPISYYKELAPLHAAHGITIVQHRETNKIYVKKEMTVYSLPVFAQLFLHPIVGIPRIYALYENEGKLTSIEEYISGETLEDLLKICGSFSVKEVAQCAIGLCDILDRLHRQAPPIIHRDIKPSNVILTEDHRVVLIDLNAARSDDKSKSRDTKLLGTEGYAAPEQFGFGSSGPATDLYNTGMLMKTLLGYEDASLPTGHPLAPIIEKCIQLDPRNRFVSAGALSIALGKVLKKL